MKLLSRFELEMRGDHLSGDCSATAVRHSNKLRRSRYTKISSGELFRTFLVACDGIKLAAAATTLKILRLYLFARRKFGCNAAATFAKKVYDHKL